MKDYDYEGFKDFMNHFYQYNESTLLDELDLLDQADAQVQQMTEYPEAEQLLASIMTQK